MSYEERLRVHTKNTSLEQVYREYSIIRQLQQKSVGSRIVGLSINFLMGLYWSGLQKKVSAVKTVGLSSVRLSNILCLCIMLKFMYYKVF